MRNKQPHVLDRVTVFPQQRAAEFVRFSDGELEYLRSFLLHIVQAPRDGIPASRQPPPGILRKRAPDPSSSLRWPINPSSPGSALSIRNAPAPSPNRMQVARSVGSVMRDIVSAPITSILWCAPQLTR